MTGPPLEEADLRCGAWTWLCSRTGMLFLFTVLLFAALIPAGYIDSVDAGSRIAQAEAIVWHGTLDVATTFSEGELARPPMGWVKGSGGRYWSQYGLGMPLLWALPVALAGVVAGVTGFSRDLLAGAVVSSLNVFVSAAILASVYRMTRSAWGDRRAAVLSAISLLAGSTLLPYANGCFSEPAAALAVLWTGWFATVGRRVRWSDAWCGLTIWGAYLLKPEMALLGIPVVLAELPDVRRSLRTGAVALGAVALTELTLWGIRGSIVTAAYGANAGLFGSPIAGLAGYFLGLEKNAFLFFPVLVPALAGWWLAGGKEGPVLLRRFVIAAWLVFLPLYSSSSWWFGGQAFGPRFLLVLVPVTALAAGPAISALLDRLEPWRAGRTALLVALACLASGALLFQVAGMSVRDHQADTIAREVMKPAWWVKIRLLELKVRRGIGGAEVYRVSDFSDFGRGQGARGDTVIDHSAYRTYQGLNHWWWLAMANRKHGRGLGL